MNRRARIGIIIGLLGTALVVGGVFVVLRLVQTTIAPPPAPTPRPPLTEPVAVVSHDVAAGTVLQPEDLTLVQVPIELVPRGALTDVSEAAGRITQIGLISGEMVLPHHLADPSNVIGDLGYVIEENQVLMAFPISDLMSELNLLKRGDLVDILASIEVEAEERDENGEEEEETYLYTFNSLQGLAISAVVVEVVPAQRATRIIPQGAEPTPETGEDLITAATPARGQAQEERPRAIMLALDPQDALVLKNLKDLGAVFDIVLRAPGAEHMFDLEPVGPQYLIDRYEIQGTR